MTDIHIVRHYPQPPALVWRAVTDPELVPRWTSTGAGARPEGFSPVVGTRFRFVAKPKPGWSGVVDCEVLEAIEPRLLRYTWADGDGPVTEVAYRIDPDGRSDGQSDGDGTRFTYDHTGFRGAGGFLLAKLLGRVRTRMLTAGLPPVLASLEG